MPSVEFQHSKERFLRHLDRAYLLHALFTFFLFFEEFAFSRYVSAVTFCRNILSHSLDGFAGYDFGSDCCLNGYVELLAGNKFLQFLAHASAKAHRIVHMGEGAESVHAFTVQQYIEFYELGLSEIMQVIVERSIALGNAFELVVKVYHDFAKRHVESHLHSVA